MRLKDRTWTFQPDDDVREWVGAAIGSQRGERSKLINEALRLNWHKAATSILIQEIAEKQAQLELLNSIPKVDRAEKKLVREDVDAVRSQSASIGEKTARAKGAIHFRSSRQSRSST